MKRASPLLLALWLCSLCAARSGDLRVHELQAELNETIKPRLRLVVSR